MEDNIRDKIKKILFEHPEIKECDLARAISLSPQTLNYQLNNSLKFDVELEKKIFSYFAKKSIIKYQQGQCTMISDLFLEFNSIDSQFISILSKEIRRYLQDNILTDDEAEKLLARCQNYQDDFNSKMNQLKELIKGNVK